MNAILIDHELNARQTLKQKLHTHCPTIDIVGEADNIEKAVRLIKLLKPDLLFMDILMENQLSLEILSLFPEATFQVIFVTSHSESEYILSAFKCNAAHYILKPVNDNRLVEAVRRVSQSPKKDIEKTAASQQIAKTKDKLLLETHNGTHIVLRQNIMYITTSDNPNFILFYLSCLPACKPLIVNGTLKEYEDALVTSSEFCRIHNSHIINFSHLESYNIKNLSVKMDNQKELKIARQKKEIFLAQLLNII